MSGHSKWSTIKHKKGAADAKRGQLFTKLTREITVASREGSDDPDMNFRLRLAIDNAKSQNMPKDTIERAVAKGAGKGADGNALEELTYEAYGPGGTGFIIQTLTDNRNRAASGIRSKVTRSGGNLAANGAVSWNFEQKGLVTLEVEGADPEEVALEVMDIGAEDVEIEEDLVSVTFPFQRIRPRQNRTRIAERRTHRKRRVGDGTQTTPSASRSPKRSRHFASLTNSKNSTTSPKSSPTPTFRTKCSKSSSPNKAEAKES